MSDLPQRLRLNATIPLVMEAAERIEALEADLAQWVRQAEDNSGGWQRACLRIEALETALREISDSSYIGEKAAQQMALIASAALAPEQDK